MEAALLSLEPDSSGYIFETFLDGELEQGLTLISELDSFQFVLDIAGLIPGVGELADGANGLIYIARGDTLNATLSFSAMIPFAG